MKSICLLYLNCGQKFIINFYFLFSQENNEISDSKETAEPLVQSDSPIAVPIDDSGRQFDGWSFFGGIILTIGIGKANFLLKIPLLEGTHICVNFFL